jgi:hypothetical protein
MSQSPMTRWAGPLCIAAAILVVLSQVVRLGVGLMLGSGSASMVTHTPTYLLALLGMVVLLLALTALYARESTTLGSLGLIGYLTAFLGTLLVAGDWWFEAFVVPTIATAAPEVLQLSPSGSVLAGAIVTLGVYTAGWVLFGVATLRAGAIPRPAAVLLIVGGLAGPLALSAPYQIPLAVAVGWIGYAITRAPRSTRTAPDDTSTPRAAPSSASLY